MKTKNLYALNTPLILTYRRKNKMSQKEFGRRLDGLSQQTVARWEQGSSFPDHKNLLKIAKLLKVGVKALYLVDSKLAADVPGASEDLVLLVLSFRKRLREIIDEIEWTDLEMMRIAVNDCNKLINEHFARHQSGIKPTGE